MDDEKAIRIRDARGICRVRYVARFEDAVHIRHWFQKRTQATSRQDKNTTDARYRAVVNARSSKH